jgi:outer membrane protein OmpA-like peptidoglycan-associated protein
MTVTSPQKLFVSALMLGLLTSGCGWVHWRDKEPARDASSIDSPGADVTFANDQKRARMEADKAAAAAANPDAAKANTDAGATTTPLPGAGADSSNGAGGKAVKDGGNGAAKVSPMKDAPSEIDAATEKMAGNAAGGDKMAADGNAEKVTLQGDALFQFGKGDEKSMLPGGKQRLDELADKIMAREKDTIASIQIVGHADRLGSPSGNMKISEKRAATVMNYLVRRGVDASMLESMGKGDADPITECPGGKPNKALLACLSPNRRVDVIINTK